MVTWTLFVGDARLVDGGAPTQGRVEIYINGSWWTVCDSWFGYQQGQILCSQLGLPKLFAVYSGPTFGKGNGSILTEEYYCQGNETSLLDCFKTGHNSSYCSHYDDVGIACGPLVKAGMWSYHGQYNLCSLPKTMHVSEFKVNSSFRALWVVNSEVISKYSSPPSNRRERF